MNNLELVLYQPQIPQNTGSIGRLCVNTETKLHLIKPLGFSLEEKYLRRAGLDYWQYLNLDVHEDWNQFFKKTNSDDFLFFLSTRGKKIYWDCPFEKVKEINSKIYLIFGSETSGFSSEVYNTFKEHLYTIPMFGEHSRSYNLANSAAIVLFEAIRQLTS